MQNIETGICDLKRCRNNDWFTSLTKHIFDLRQTIGHKLPNSIENQLNDYWIEFD